MSGIILVFLVLFILQVTTGHWWWLFVVPFLCGAFRSKTSVACIRSSALGAGLLWMIGAVFALLTDSYRIASQVAALGGIESPLIAVLATTLVAAVAGGVAGLVGFQLKTLLRGQSRSQDIPIVHTPRKRAHHHDRRRPAGEDPEDQATAVPGGTGRSRAHR